MLSIHPAAMEGHGAYNRHSAVQGAALGPAIARLQQSAAQVALPAEPMPLIVADYGSAQGHNSMAPVAAALAALRARTGQARAISVFHTDLPGNDWPALFATLSDDPASYRRQDPAAFPAAIGASFFTQLLPPASVTLGWSSWALHWLSGAPAPIPDHLHAACSRDPGARAAYAAQAARDWEDFLRARAAELRPGGRLVLLFRATEGDAFAAYLGVFEAAWQAVSELTASGFLSEAERAHMIVPTYGRSRAEILAPFATGAFHGLAVEQLTIAPGEDPIWTETGGGRDAARYAASWAAFFRAAAFPSLAAGLGPAGGETRTAEFFDRAEAAMRAHLARETIPRAMPLACLTLRREPDPV